MQRSGELASKVLIMYPPYMCTKCLQSGNSYKYQFVLVKARATLHFEAGDG